MSSTIIGWIISIIFVVILFGGFSVGFWRGFKRSTASLIFSLAGLVLAFFITPPITNAILKIEVGYNGSQVPLYNILLEVLLSIGDVKTMVNNNPNLELLVANIPTALCNTIIFIFVTIAVECVVYLIFKVICIAVIKDKSGKCVGGLLGLVKAFVVTVVACMPLASLVGLANKVVATNDYGITTVAALEVEGDESAQADEEAGDQTTGDQTTGDETTGDEAEPEVTVVTKGLARDYVPDNVVIVIQGFENNLLTKCSNLFGLDDMMFDYYGSVKVDGGKVEIRKEIENFYDVADFGYQMTKYGIKEIDYTKIDYDKVNAAVDKLTNSDLFKKVLSYTVSDVIENYSSYSFMSKTEAFQDVLDDIGAYLSTLEDKSEYFRNDLVNIVKSVEALGKGNVINDIFALDSMKPALIADALTKEANIDAFKAGLKNILSLNVLKDSASTIMGKVIEKTKLDVDAVGIDGRAFTEEDWQEIEANLTNVVKDFGLVAKNVEINDLLSDATILLDKEANYDIKAITTAFGEMIDNLRVNKLLKTSEGKAIIDKLIETNKLVLDVTKAYDNEGKEVSIDGYKAAFEFVSDSFILLRDEGVYDLVKGAGETNDNIKTLANLISKEGKEGLLSDIILPLYQINFTRDLIVEQVAESVSGEFINMTILDSYDAWKSDLADVSNLLITLNTLELDNIKYLDLVMNGSFKLIFNNASEEDIVKIIRPILTPISTDTLKDNLFASLKVEMDKYTDEEITLSTEGVSFRGEESQTNEICEIIKKFVLINRTMRTGETLKDVDHKVAGDLLETMKENAYRVENDKTEEGMFKDAYIKLVNALKTSYSAEVEAIENDPEKLAVLGVENLNVENYNKLSITKLFELIDGTTSETPDAGDTTGGSETPDLGGDTNEEALAA